MNVIIPTPPHPTPTWNILLRSIKHVCKSETNILLRSIKHVCKCKWTSSSPPHPTTPCVLTKLTTAWRSSRRSHQKLGCINALCNAGFVQLLALGEANLASVSTHSLRAPRLCQSLSSSFLNQNFFMPRWLYGTRRLRLGTTPLRLRWTQKFPWLARERQSYPGWKWRVSHSWLCQMWVALSATFANFKVKALLMAQPLTKALVLANREQLWSKWSYHSPHARGKPTSQLLCNSYGPPRNLNIDIKNYGLEDVISGLKKYGIIMDIYPLNTYTWQFCWWPFWDGENMTRTQRL